MADYTATVRSAKGVLPIAVQMEELFPVADHFITHYGFSSGPQTWNTEVFFVGRYTLTMQVDVEIDYKNNKIVKMVDSPRFWLHDVRAITPHLDGRTSATFNGQNEKTFGAREWNAIYHAKGELSAIGVSINPVKVRYFEDYVSNVRRDRIPVSLLEKQ